MEDIEVANVCIILCERKRKKLLDKSICKLTSQNDVAPLRVTNSKIFYRNSFFELLIRLCKIITFTFASSSY